MAGEDRGGLKGSVAGEELHLYPVIFFSEDLLLSQGRYLYLVHIAWGCRLTDLPLNPLGFPRGSSWSASGLTYE